jgi:hypothetical protein
MIEWNFPVAEYDGTRRVRDVSGVLLGPDGMEIRSEQVPSGRYAWLGFDLPDGRHVKALSEVVAVIADGATKRIRVHFKHLWPADRMAMEGFMEARAAA